MKPKPTEVKLVLELLVNEEWEDEKECAAAIVDALYESWMGRRSRQPYCLAVQTSGPALIYGPYATKVEAERAWRKGIGQAGGGIPAVFKMTAEDQAEEALT